jgi:two-component system sensor histidine kinase BaeS
MMRSLRTRVFVTVALVLAAATLAAGLLSREATLIEERQIVGPRRPPSIDGLATAVQGAYERGGWDAVRSELRSAADRLDVRLLAIDSARRPVAASNADLEAVHVRAASPDGLLSLERGDRETRAAFEMRGVPTFAVNAADGTEAARVFVLPPERLAPDPEPALIPRWVRTTIVTAAVALLIALAVAGRILRPVGELTRAVRRMREGDLDVRVAPRGDDEIARLARAFNDMAERLAQTERTKRQMVTDVAHELRSPVTNLRCGLEAIQDGLAAPDRGRIDALHAEVVLLQRLIADLEDLALAEAGGLTLRREAIDIAAAVRRATAAETDGAPVTVQIADDASTVAADPGRFDQMLRNLIGNARRHTPPEGRIEVRAARADGAVRIEVADSGSGIAPEHLPHVFDRFYRADASRDRATGGAGLGLAIVRRLAEAHGGSVSARSDGPGRGATFTLILPS